MTKDQKKSKKGSLGEFLGHSVVSVIRAMGAAGWTFPEARAALDTAHISAADQTIRIQLKAGKDGKGKAAVIDSAKLMALRPSVPVEKADKASDSNDRKAGRKGNELKKKRGE